MQQGTQSISGDHRTQDQKQEKGARWKEALILAGMIVTALLIQWANGAYGKDFSSHPDEAAHVVTGLMVRDYITEGIPAGVSPMKYAQNYYDHLPKVALGHYPPGFYAVEGIWMTPFRTPQAALALVAVLAGIWAYLVYRCGRRLLPGRTAAVAAGVLLLLLPEVQSASSMVMSDVLMALFCLGAILAFARYLETQRAAWSLAFGILAAAAAMTKASGFLLALVPPAAMILTGQWRLVFRWNLWLAVLPVALTALPWTFATRGITQEGMLNRTASEHIQSSVPFYGWALTHLFGYGVLALIVAGLVRLLADLFRGRRPLPAEACLWALGAACLAFYVVTPAGLETRYLLPMLPWVILAILALSPRPGEAGPATVWKSAILPAAAVLILCGAERLRLQPVKSDGYNEAAAFIDREVTAAPGHVLVSSDPPGEGGIIAALAFDFSTAQRDSIMVMRGTKVLSTSDWMSRGYKLTYETPEALRDYLKTAGLRCIAADHSLTTKNRRAHHQLLEETVAKWPEEFPETGRFKVVRPDGSSGDLVIYTVKPQP